MLKTVRRSQRRFFDGLIKSLSRSYAESTGKCPPGTSSDTGKRQSNKSCPPNRGGQSGGAGSPNNDFNRLYGCAVGNGQMAFHVLIVKGEGVYVYDNLGNKYLDFTAGDSTVMLGHCHKGVLQSMYNQAQLLTQSTKSCQNYPLGIFSAYICDLFGYDKVITMNSGVEAVETAIKIARKFGYKHKNIPENEAKIVIPENSRWGKSLAAISTLGNKELLKKLGPHLPGFESVPFNDIQALEEKLKNPHVCGFLVEPIQADAGVIVPDPCYLSEVRRICNENRVLLMADEVHVGLGRCGSLTCSSIYSVTPDILILGKSLSSGFLPVSATLADKEIMDICEDEVFGSSYGGFPLGCAVALTALEALVSEKLIANSRNMGIVLRQALEIALPTECVKCIRGRGLLCAIELQGIFRGYVSVQLFYDLLCNGLLIRPPFNGVIRLCPPLCIKENQIIQAVRILRAALLKLRGYCELNWDELEKSCERRSTASDLGCKSQMPNCECESENDSRKQTKKPPMIHMLPAVTNVQCEEAESSAGSKGKSKNKSRMAQKKDCDDTGAGRQTSSCHPMSNTSTGEDLDDRLNKLLKTPEQDKCGENMFQSISSITKISQGFSNDTKIDDCAGPTIKTSTPKMKKAEDCAELPGTRNQMKKQNKSSVSDEWIEISDQCAESAAGHNKMKRQNRSNVSDECAEIHYTKNSPPKMQKADNKRHDSEDCVEPPGTKKSKVDCGYGNENFGGGKQHTDEPEQCLNDEMPLRSTQPVCKLFPYCDAEDRSPIIPLEVICNDMCARRLSHGEKSPVSNKDQCEEEKDSKSKLSRNEDCEKQPAADKCAQVAEKYKSGGPIAGESSDDEKCPEKKKLKLQDECKPLEGKSSHSKVDPCKADPCKADPCKPSSESKQQDCEKPQEPAEKCKPFQYIPVSSEKFECAPVSKRTDRGKQLVTAKGIQPIPKKTSAGKKFYAQDVEIPSASKGIAHDNVNPAPCKEGPAEKEKSSKPKSEECKKSLSNENIDSKNSKPDCKPDSGKNSDAKPKPLSSDPSCYIKTFSPDLYNPSKKK